MDKNKIWSEVQEYIESNITPTAYYLWFSAIELAYLDDTSAKLNVPKELNLNVIKAEYSKLIEKAFEKALGHKISVELSCNDTDNINSESSKYTFDNFVVKIDNRLAFVAARNIAVTIALEPSETSELNIPNPLLIYGEKPAGKTHLLNAIRNEIKSNKPNLEVALVDENNPIGQVSTNADVLLADDVQLYKNDEFFKIYKSFIANKKQVVLTADKPYSEFADGLLADIQPVEFETKNEIITSQAASSKNTEVETTKSTKKSGKNKFMKTIGKLAGSAALKVAEGATYIVEETSAAMGMDFVTEGAYNLRNKSSEKVAELWDKQPKELTMATGEKVRNIVDGAVSLALSNISNYEKNVDEYERKLNEYENNYSNPDYEKISEARNKIQSARENIDSAREQFNQ